MAWMKRSWFCNEGAKKREGGTGLFWKTCAHLPEANLVLQWIYKKNFDLLSLSLSLPLPLSLFLTLPFHLDRLWNRMSSDENVSQTLQSGIWVMNRQPENRCSASSPHFKEKRKRMHARELDEKEIGFPSCVMDICWLGFLRCILTLDLRCWECHVTLSD